MTHQELTKTVRAGAFHSVSPHYNELHPSLSAANIRKRADRLVGLVLTVVEGVLAIRFLLSFWGTDRGSELGRVVYSITEPWVRPFYGILGRNTQDSGVRFEFEILVAMLAYAIFGLILTKLLSLNENR